VFDRLLREMLDKTPGALGATIMGYDGVPVACLTPKGKRSDQEIGDDLWEAASIDLLLSIAEIQKATDRLDAGNVDQVTIQTGAFTLLMRPLSEHYVLVLALENEAWAGKGRYIMRVVGAEIRQELL